MIDFFKHLQRDNVAHSAVNVVGRWAELNFKYITDQYSDRYKMNGPSLWVHVLVQIYSVILSTDLSKVHLPALKSFIIRCIHKEVQSLLEEAERNVCSN